ncbi:MAG TPA: hypothetical protein VL549_09925 [Gemmatimonadales bacterium]|nr:hypothetical protein [Gemmatimonadales bacterium]
MSLLGAKCHAPTERRAWSSAMNCQNITPLVREQSTPCAATVGPSQASRIDST